MQTHALREKIQALETEKSDLMGEIENLRKAAETRAAALKGDIDQMREEVKNMRELLARDEQIEIIVMSSDTQPIPATQVNSVAPTVLDTPTGAPAPEIVEPKPPVSAYKYLVETLMDDERKVVEVLEAHGGKYPRKYIRSEAGMSWLQTNRIISRLAERGVVTFEKNRNMDNVLLANQLK